MLFLSFIIHFVLSLSSLPLSTYILFFIFLSLFLFNLFSIYSSSISVFLYLCLFIFLSVYISVCVSLFLCFSRRLPQSYLLETSPTTSISTTRPCSSQPDHQLPQICGLSWWIGLVLWIPDYQISSVCTR